ncbi:MAG: PepSY domain-containing protein [Oscillospiraceae bacterium]|nr:PepSY domain-containing protein [Oscillospiraceae bacterium]
MVLNILPTAPPAPPATDPPAAQLTAEEAKAIALEHAGFSSDQVSRLRAEFDWDDGVPVYDVEFHEGYWEYDYEIHAETGKIRSFDKDD